MLPFIAGVAVGVLGVSVYKNRKEIKKNIECGAKKAKAAAEIGLEKSKDIAKNAKSKIEKKAQNLKCKDEEEKLDDILEEEVEVKKEKDTKKDK